jgi:hypothetical protein
MNKIISFFKTSSPLILLLIGLGIEGLSKLIEKKVANLALGLQMISFIIIVYALIRLINRK